MRLLLPRSSSQIQKSNPLSDRRVLSGWCIQQDLFPQELQCRKALSKAWPLRARTLSVRVLLPRRIIHSHAVPGWQVLSRRLLEAEILHPRAVPEQQAVRPAQHQQQARHHSAAGLRSAADVRPAQPARRLHLLHRPRGRVRPLLLRHQRVPAPPAPAPHLSQDHPSQPPHQPAHDAARHAAPAALPHLPAGPLGGPVLRRRLRQLPVRPVPGGPLLPRVRRHHRPLPGRQLLPGRLLGARPVPRRLLLRARVQGARAVPGGPQVPARRHRPEEVRLSAAAAEDRGAEPPGPCSRPAGPHARQPAARLGDEATLWSNCVGQTWGSPALARTRNRAHSLRALEAAFRYRPCPSGRGPGRGSHVASVKQGDLPPWGVSNPVPRGLRGRTFPAAPLRRATAASSPRLGLQQPRPRHPACGPAVRARADSLARRPARPGAVSHWGTGRGPRGDGAQCRAPARGGPGWPRAVRWARRLAPVCGPAPAP